VNLKVGREVIPLNVKILSVKKLGVPNGAQVHLGVASTCTAASS
jgi:hypothetical protein